MTFVLIAVPAARPRAAILLEEIASDERWSQSFAKSERVLESLASEALAEFRAGKTKPLDEL